MRGRHNPTFWPLLGTLVAGAAVGALVASIPAPGQAAPAARTTPTLASKVLVIVPLGKTLSNQDVAEVKVALKTFYGYQVKMGKRRKLPRSAWYRPRRRYRADKLLDHLARIGPKKAHRILGLTAVDISTTKGRYRDWGILGLATLSGRVCVISRFRCRKGAKSTKHIRHRLAKVAVHEIGHTLGLDHCPQRGCLLEAGKGSVKTSDREYVLCKGCRAKLRKKGYVLPPNPKPPWPKP